MLGQEKLIVKEEEMPVEEIAKRIRALDFALNFLVNRISPDQNIHFCTLQDIYFDLQEEMEKTVEK